MLTRTALIAVGFGFGLPGEAGAVQTDDPPVEDATADEGLLAAEKQFFESLRSEGITLDLEHREVRVHGTLRRSRPDPERPIELGLVTPEGSVHEALGVVECTPSLLNACFLWLGLEPGQPRTYVAREPEPTMEDLEMGLELPYRVLPPKGARVFCFVRWIDESGEERIEALEDLLIQPRTGEELPMRGFVYIGSRFVEHLGEEIYIADHEGNVALVFPDKAFPQNCLLDVFATATEDYRGVDVNLAKAPETGTPLEFIFTPVAREDARPVEPAQRPVVMFPDAAETAGKSRNPFVRQADRALLARFGARSLSEYRRILRRGKPELRELTCGVLGVSGRPEAAELLGAQLRYDRSAEVRLAAAWGLVEIADDAAIEQLLLTLEQGWWAPRDDAVFAFRLLSGEDRGRSASAWRDWANERRSVSREGR